MSEYLLRAAGETSVRARAEALGVEAEDLVVQLSGGVLGLHDTVEVATGLVGLLDGRPRRRA
jgi:hypothetical protein